MTKFQAFLLLILTLLNYSEESIFTSIIRTNLNRYLKNPLFTKSFVRNSMWSGEDGGHEDHGASSSALLSPQNDAINEFINSQNKFTSEHLMQPYAAAASNTYNFNIVPPLKNEFPTGLIPPPPPPPPPSTGGNSVAMHAKATNIIPQQAQRNSKFINNPPPPLPSPSPPLSQPSSQVHHHGVGSTTMHNNNNNNKVLDQRPPPNLNRVNITNGNNLDTNNEKPNRLNSKSLTVSATNLNAYSNSSKLKPYTSIQQQSANLYGGGGGGGGGNKNGSPTKLDRVNLYADNKLDVSHSIISSNSVDLDDQLQQSTLNDRFSNTGSHHHHHHHHRHRHHKDNDATTASMIGSSSKNFENHLAHGNKYNQEKALNLKMEYGFKPLPPVYKPLSSSMLDSLHKDFTVGNSIQLGDALEIVSNNNNNEKEDDQSQETNGNTNNNNNNIYSSIENENLNRSMKSLVELATLKSSSSLNNHLDEFGASDYKKYISYPMETESSDIHKLAFTGMESFKPDHSFASSSLSFDYLQQRPADTLSNYPNIRNFKTQGIDCARNMGYCEYDSSYPKDHVNALIGNCSDHIDNMYIEMPDNLADFDGYKSFIQVGRSNTRNVNNNSLCDSERKYIRPSVAQDITGVYYLILQSSFYFQQVPVEICSKPGSACNVLSRCHSSPVKCTQKYRTHMLISIDSSITSSSNNNDGTKPRNGTANHNHNHNHHHQWSASADSRNKASPLCPRMRMYRLPSACVCELDHT